MKYFLFFYILTAISVYKYVEKIRLAKQYPNYLPITALNLDQHLISLNNPRKDSILILGSSSASGSNIPRNGTLADYFNSQQEDFTAYNLAKLEGTAIDEIIFLKLALEKTHTKIVFFGISPTIFKNILSTITTAYNLEVLRSAIPADLFQKIYQENQKKFFIRAWMEYIAAEYYPLKPLISYKTLIYHAREAFFGPTMTPNMWGANNGEIFLPKNGENP